MPAKQEPNIGINYGWAGGESGINLQLDENWRAIGALLQLSVISKTTDVPATPSAGDRYIVPTGATGDWSGHDGKVARYNESVWEIYTPLKGWLAYLEDVDQYQFFDGATWAPAPIDDAGQVTYNNATSGLTAQDVQAAIDELAAEPGGVTSVDGQTGAVDLSGNYEVKRQNNLTATTDPTVTDDSSLGYEPLSRWINTSTAEIWLCVDATAGAADWQKASLTLDELGSAALADVGTGSTQVPRNSDLPTASETTKGMVEKATTTEAQNGTEGKFPDAAGVHAAFGKHGVGAFVGNTSGSADSVVTPGSAIWLNSAATGKPAGSNSGLLEVTTAASSNTITQTFTESATSSDKKPRIFFRQRNAASGSWNQWYEHFLTGNILGTVSQSGGVPTGAIIERGSNSNGEYVKFADGTMICSRLVTGVDLTGAYNPGAAISWPASFIDTKYTISYALGVSSVNAQRARAMSEIGVTAALNDAFYFAKADGNNIAETRDVIFTGIGRWF